MLERIGYKRELHIDNAYNPFNCKTYSKVWEDGRKTIQFCDYDKTVSLRQYDNICDEVSIVELNLDELKGIIEVCREQRWLDEFC